MIVECSHCHTKYNIDEKKVPDSGIKTQCPKCKNIIFIKKEEPTPQPTTPPEVPTEVTEPPEPEVPKPAEPEVTKPSEPEISVEAETPPVVEEPKPTPPPTVEMSEEDKKWHERARRLAKALASDLVLYNRDKVEKGLREGTLGQLLGSEIRRSWEYYCQQIPKHIVERSDYFKEQLNKIVCKGKEIFK